MKRLYITLVVLLVCPVYTDTAVAAGWDLARNVKRLERLAPDYKDDKEVDKRFLDVLDLTEKTRKENEIYAEAKRIAGNPTLAQSKYMDSFLYYMFVRSLDTQKDGTAELDVWLGQLKSYTDSPHLLPAQLIRIRRLSKNATQMLAETEALVSWLKTRKPDFVVRAPEYSRSLLLSYEPRTNFADGEVPKLYKVSYYRSSVTTLAGFQEDETYVSLLGRIKAKHEDIMNEMIGIYRNTGKRKEAADIYFQLAELKIKSKDYKEAAALLENAVKFNPEHVAAKNERNRIKLELTYQALNPPADAAKPAETPVTQPADKPAEISVTPAADEPGNPR